MCLLVVAPWAPAVIISAGDGEGVDHARGGVGQVRRFVVGHQAEGNVAAGGQAQQAKITVKQDVEQWLEVAELEDTTSERYDDLIRLYILPASHRAIPIRFGSVPAHPAAGRCSRDRS